MPNHLAGKNIVLGVCGGIAAYKSPDLVRRLCDAGADVQVVMTASAQQFVTPLTFQAVSGHPVRTDLWDTAAEAAMGHIELARWADLIVVAPASANFISRLAHGMADDLLATLCLASKAPIRLVPAMNRVMWTNPATQANCKLLISRGISLLGPAEGPLAEGESGIGRMLEPLDIVAALQPVPGHAALEGIRVMITAGPTREAIDPVRYVGNRSSGKMGYAIAAAAVEAGARVTLVSGPVNLPVPAGVACTRVESAADMHAAVMRGIGQTDLFIAAAAVADYAPVSTASGKLKKDDDSLLLTLHKTTDILAEVAAIKPPPFTVGFAAETDDLEANATAKLKSKNLHMIAANQVGGGKGFESDENALIVIWKGGREVLQAAPKTLLARKLITLIASQFRKKS